MVDRSDEVGQGHAASDRNLLEPFPERILEADTRLVPSDHDRAFDDRRFHLPSPSIRCDSSRRRAWSRRASSPARSAFVRPCLARFCAARSSCSRRAARLRTARKLTTSPMSELDVTGYRSRGGFLAEPSPVLRRYAHTAAAHPGVARLATLMRYIWSLLR